MLNLAQGELVLFGPYIAWSLLESGIPLPLALLIMGAGVAVQALLIERLALHPLLGQPTLAAMLMALGLGAVLRGLMTIIGGGGAAQEVALGVSRTHSSCNWRIGANMTAEYLYAFIAAIVLFMIFAYFFNRTRGGLDMRVVADDQRATPSVGIRVTTTVIIVWVISALVSSIAISSSPLPAASIIA